MPATTSSQGPARSARAKRFFAIPLAVLVLLAVVEGVLRLSLVPEDELLTRRFDPVERAFDARRGRPASDGSATRYDAEGFRSEPHASDATRSVLFIGDGFTLGVGVPSGASLVAVAEADLRRRGTAVRGYNAGVSGLGTASGLRLLRQLLPRRRYDAIVFQISPHDDLNRNRSDDRFALHGDRLTSHPPSVCGARVEALDSLYLVRVLKTLAARRAAASRDLDRDGRAFALEMKLLREVIDLADRYHVPVLFLLVGNQEECTAHLRPTSHDDRFERFVALTRALIHPTFDVCRMAHRPGDFGQDGHFTAPTNARVGRMVADRLAALFTPVAP